ncbi:MAG: sigma-54 dependent transcriptional regulator [Bacteroidetes bacterium]|nr:sigma-54 dependent transcriptional regulator [Bacteroidota bacterium]MBU2584067.1 sigma-54 dependent transcriptional regulator [Bacteroidota bacterium]
MAESISKSVFIKIIENQGAENTFSWLFDTIPNALIRSFPPDDISLSFSDSKRGIFIFNLIDLSKDVFNCIDNFKEESQNDNIIVVTSKHHAIETAELIRQGHNQVFFLPDDQFILRKYVSELVNQKINEFNSDIYKHKEKKKHDFSCIIGNSKSLIEAIEISKTLSQNSDISVLITGETGTGKELFARTIHLNSDRSREPFIDIVCSAIPETLLESELFGHMKGSFTDARIDKPGLFEIAGNGTIFLDEIGDLNQATQVKILKAIENKVLRRIGGLKDIPINGRIIAATHRNLEELVQQGKFRLDLYHRLKVIAIEIPPLRDRSDDLFILAEKFIQENNLKYNKKLEGFTKQAKRKLKEYQWPGNVRELAHIIERGVLLSKKNKLDENDLVFNYKKSEAPSGSKTTLNLKIKLGEAKLTNLELKLSQEVLKSVDGNKSEAAKILGISRPKLDRILKNS